MTLLRSTALAAACLLAANCAQALTPSEQILEQFIDAKDGSVITLPAGRFEFNTTLSISANNVTVKGAGMDKTVLSFQGQNTGNGIDATGKNLKFEDFAILDSKADGLKVQNCEDLVIRRVSVDWSGPPKETNGGYGLYPVACKRILVEDSYIRGASDSGLYVGQTEDIVLRRNRVTENVAGIEIENSIRADVYDNDAYANTGGILVFSMPDLPVIQNGAGTRVFNNRIRNNNTPNFAGKGNIVGLVPAGTGIMILANRDVEVFGNSIENHQSASVIVTSFYASERPIKDPNYEAQARNTSIHDNVMLNAGYDPAGIIAEIKDGAWWAGVNFKRMPHVLHDGIKAGKIKDIAELNLCFKNNQMTQPQDAFANLDLENAGTLKALVRWWKPRAYSAIPAAHDCTLPPYLPLPR
ncbi:parallel beta-helix domain-containing protein [Curvibacter sp. APW13]|uniref:parallel beta-helix domain-containing protein n=1 Tax=Curvibacter sp. APW13 TaxID=3077236 RepID=UPI0028E0112B|nr:parallel beta-helix domain-containing protein [Curvibacter sp. APW13]MDT8991204.1 parallel beta-helix domain-containing protein [Curvibacter sp. APW13]